MPLSLSALSAGFVAVLVGFTSSIAIVYQAAQALHATPAETTSWIWAISVGVGLSTLVPSWLWKKPLMIAWSTPGAAVLATAASTASYSTAQAIGAFMVCAVLIVLSGATGWFERIMDRIPTAIAAALLAGVLTRFGLQAFGAAQTATLLVAAMLLTYLVAKRAWTRYAVPLTLAMGVAVSAAQGLLRWDAVQISWAQPVLTLPEWHWGAIVNLALPLYVVTMASQNLPGVAAIRAAGYGGADGIPISRAITITGATTLLLAPFGAYALNLAAITAAICMGPEAHPDRTQRYTAAVVSGTLYVLVGVFATAVTGLLVAFPKELVAAIAGLALLGTIGNALHASLHHEQHREAAVITFLVTLSGVTVAGIGSAFWGVVAGALALLVLRMRRT